MKLWICFQQYLSYIKCIYWACLPYMFGYFSDWIVSFNVW